MRACIPSYLGVRDAHGALVCQGSQEVGGLEVGPPAETNTTAGEAWPAQAATAKAVASPSPPQQPESSNVARGNIVRTPQSRARREWRVDRGYVLMIHVYM